MTLRWNWYGCPPIKSWCASLPKLPHPPTAVIASAHARAELKLLREPLSAAAHAACERVRTLESSGAFNCSGAGPACGKNVASQANVHGGLPTPSDERRLPPEDVKNSRTYEGMENQRDWASDCPCDHPIITPCWFSAPGLALPMGSLPDTW